MKISVRTFSVALIILGVIFSFAVSKLLDVSVYNILSLLSFIIAIEAFVNVTALITLLADTQKRLEKKNE